MTKNDEIRVGWAGNPGHGTLICDVVERDNSDRPVKVRWAYGKIIPVEFCHSECRYVFKNDK